MATFGWPDNNLTVPEDVRRLWDSERMGFSDDDPCLLLDQLDVLIPDTCTDEDYQTDNYNEDYRIEEALEGCPFETDNEV